MSIDEVRRALKNLPEVVNPDAEDLKDTDLLTVAAEFTKVLRKIGVQQTRSGTDLVGQVKNATLRLDEVHQAALDARDRAVQAERQAEKLAFVLIGHLDLLERAIDVMKSAGGLVEWTTSLEDGIEGALADAAKWGLSTVGVEGETFDPQVHDAVNQVERTDTELSVRSVERRGFTLNGRVLRPARVEIGVEDEEL